MPISNIKYKLVARHGIKNDTFKDFMKYIFKTSGAPNENIVQNHINIALLNVL